MRLVGRLAFHPRSSRRSRCGSPCRGRPSGSRGSPSATRPSRRCRRPPPPRTAPASSELAVAGRQRARLSVGARSGRRVGIVADPLTVCVPRRRLERERAAAAQRDRRGGRADLDVEGPPAPVQSLERDAVRQLRGQHRVEVDAVLAPAQPREAEREDLREAARAGEEVVGRRARERVLGSRLVAAGLGELRERDRARRAGSSASGTCAWHSRARRSAPRRRHGSRRSSPARRGRCAARSSRACWPRPASTSATRADRAAARCRPA